MGNLYTHIVRKNDPKIGILYDLKLAWKSKPVDMRLIKRLQEKLKRIEQNTNKKEVKRKKYIGQYG